MTYYIFGLLFMIDLPRILTDLLENFVIQILSKDADF